MIKYILDLEAFVERRTATPGECVQLYRALRRHLHDTGELVEGDAFVPARKSFHWATAITGELCGDEVTKFLAGD